LGSWHWRGARGGLQGLHARDRRYDGAHQGQQHRRQGRRQLGKLARGEAGTQPHRRRAGYALGGCGGSSSEPPEVTGRRERLSGSCRFKLHGCTELGSSTRTAVPVQLYRWYSGTVRLLLCCCTYAVRTYEYSCTASSMAGSVSQPAAAGTSRYTDTPYLLLARV
jgi:hypothetical protein